MLNNEDFFNLAKEIKSGFGLRRKYLFIGNRFKKEQLPDGLCRQLWSAVITTSNSDELSGFFKKTDREIVCVENSDMKIEPNTDIMPIFYLHKIDESSPWHNEDSFAEVLSDVMRKISGETDVIYTIGLYNDELDITKLCRRITTYHMGQKTAPDKEICNLKVYEEELAEFFTESDSMDDDFEQIVTNENRFYKNGSYVSLSDEDLMQTRRFFTLATSGIVEGNRPIGDKQLTLAFENFLKLSPTDGPQWYGYIDGIEFNVKRPFEDALVKVVTQALNGEFFKTKSKYDPTRPIVLMGPPASSKSITLGSLAYRVFAQRNNPVIFIKNYDIDFSDDNIFEMLDGLMSKIDDLDGNAKSLLIWDSSSNRNTLNTASTLANKLYNRGRRFVMVCSSYEYKLSKNEYTCMCFDNQKQSWTSWNDKIHEDNTSYVKVLRRKQDLIIKSNRSVTDGEIEEIKKRYKKYAGIDIDKKLPFLRDRGTDGNDIFMYFYHLAYFLRNPLEKSLKNEQFIFTHMYDKELRKIFENKSNSRFGDICPEFFEKFGISADDFGSGMESEYPEEHFRRFQRCVALFSQFKIKTPRELAMAVLDIITSGIAYSTDNKNIYRFVEEDIPWIRCATTNGEIFFEFRNTEEASLYIQEQFERTEKGFEECMNLILSLFDAYMKFEEPSRAIVKCFSELLKELGPNREWEWYSSNKFSAEFRVYFKEHMDVIIQKLDVVIGKKLDYEYSLTLNKITLRREYYGDKDFSSRVSKCHTDAKECAQMYEENMDKLEETLSYTDGRINEIKNQSYTGNFRIQKNQMITELATCNSVLFERQKKYLEFCKDNGVPPAEKWSKLKFKSEFKDLFDDLIEAIDSNPQNGYFYNAVFKIYESYNEINPKIDYVIFNRLENIIENSIIYNVINRGANSQDEMGKHISHFKADMCKSTVTLDRVLNNSDDISDFMKYHERMLEKGDASSICFIANSELMRNEIIGQGIISRNNNFDKLKLEICKKVRDYMKSDKIYRIVRRDHNALQILFRVCWICNEEIDPYSDFNKEFRITQMNERQWNEINEICKCYVDVCANENILGSFFIKYIYALSTVQVALISGKDVAKGFERCFNIVYKLNENQFIGTKQRMKAPFLLCKESGEPFTFNFKVQEVKQSNTGFAVLYDNPILSEQKQVEEIRFRIRAENIGKSKSIPREGTYMKGLAVGLSYMSFSVCNKDRGLKGGRK